MIHPLNRIETSTTSNCQILTQRAKFLGNHNLRLVKVSHRDSLSEGAWQTVGVQTWRIVKRSRPDSKTVCP
ncbi:hypothetical protein CC2G_003008 [Coprinopsis cinerea AmutBmut pab1-1]|nr:hypothetical protein CC2G_003008 [Coprinopsis cinerea AmutBmut pab1-1]